MKRRQLVERMDAAVTAMDGLFDALLDISKLDLGVLVPNISEFSIADVLERIDSTFSGAADKKGIALRTVSSSSWVRSDPILLERISAEFGVQRSALYNSWRGRGRLSPARRRVAHRSLGQRRRNSG